MLKRLSFGLLVLLICSTTIAKQYLPIVLVHGILSDALDMKPTENYIRKYLGDESAVYIKSVNIGCGQTSSLINIYQQIDFLRQEIKADSELKNGFNMIAHSQGGLVARYYIEQYNKPRVVNYIAWGSPQQGVFGTPGSLDDRFSWLNYLEPYAYQMIYSWAFQKYVGFASYWHDSVHTDSYLKNCKFLPYLNNEIPHAQAALFKKNICALKNMVLVMSYKEDVIEPRESCHFGFYKVGSKTGLMTLFETDLYTSDRLGIKTLYENGKLHIRYANCTHTQFQEDEDNFVKNGLEFLREKAL